MKCGLSNIILWGEGKLQIESNIMVSGPRLLAGFVVQ